MKSDSIGARQARVTEVFVVSMIVKLRTELGTVTNNSIFISTTDQTLIYDYRNELLEISLPTYKLDFYLERFNKCILEYMICKSLNSTALLVFDIHIIGSSIKRYIYVIQVTAGLDITICILILLFCYVIQQSEWKLNNKS